MKTKDVIEHFGSVRSVADALGIKAVQSVYDWGDAPPLGRQYQIQLLTKGKLKANQSDSQPAA